MPQSVVYYQNQNYGKLKKACLQSHKLFEDPQFPATSESIFYQRSPPVGTVWKRPKEICSNPQLFVDGISSRDLHQGSLGNCWLVAAASCLATEPSVWKKVIPNHKEQDWDSRHPEKYAGIFHFCFWRFGCWVDVTIDDRLPTVNGQLIFCRSTDVNEFWCALLEKAYAKLNGCYETLEGGNTAEALVDFTGGISEPICLEEENVSEDLEKKKKLFKSLTKAHSRASLISCSIRPAPGEEMESQMSCGLVKGHAYGVTDIKRIQLGTGLLAFFQARKLYMIRMRNPWGSTEWCGAWSDRSEEWKKVSRSEREKMGVTVRDDGEFWMSFDDFCRYFTDLVVCRRINTSLLSIHKTWVEALLFSEWSQSPDSLKNRSGGCSNNRETFLQNPQFSFDITSDQDSALICVQQEDRRANRKSGTGQNLAMGFDVFKVEVNRKYRMHVHQGKVASSTYINSRSVFQRVELQKGKYVVVPTTFAPGETGNFLLRVFTDRGAKLRELSKNQPSPSCWSCCVGIPQLVSSVTLHSAVGLSLPGSGNEPDVYAVIKCEGQQVRSKVHKGTSKPEFDLRGIFYRKKPQTPVKIEVWVKGWRDTLLGHVTFPAAAGDMGKNEVLRLQSPRQGVTSGSLLIEISSSTDLSAL
ncbi:calpain-5 [Microcaecilia unicolor]|uniref:Calpain-5-like n=1 Tax=Microcaecilia unicolor TaxID=1415580 RepID=A0A6P7WI32_9AMPH|nr:calpain-5-like [Microcaecilia unicolor]